MSYVWDLPKDARAAPRGGEDIRKALHRASEAFNDELRDLRRRLGEARGSSQTEHQIDVLLAIAAHCERSGSLSEGIRAAEDAADLAGGESDNQVAALNALAVLRARFGEVATARRIQDNVHAARSDAGDIAGVAVALSNVGVLEVQDGDPFKALRVLDDAFRIGRSLDDPLVNGQILNNVGAIFAAQGDHEQALGLYQRGTLLGQRSGNARGLAKTYNNIGVSHAKQGDLAGTIPFLEMAGVLAAETGDLPALTVILSNSVKWYEQHYLDTARTFREWLEEATELVKVHLPQRPADATVLVLSDDGESAADGAGKWGVVAPGALLLSLQA